MILLDHRESDQWRWSVHRNGRRSSWTNRRTEGQMSDTPQTTETHNRRYWEADTESTRRRTADTRHGGWAKYCHDVSFCLCCCWDYWSYSLGWSNDELLCETQLHWRNGGKCWGVLPLDRMFWLCSRGCRCEGSITIPTQGLKDHEYFPSRLDQAFTAVSHICWTFCPTWFTVWLLDVASVSDDEDEPLGVTDRMGVRTVPTQENLKALLLQMAHKQMI